METSFKDLGNTSQILKSATSGEKFSLSFEEAIMTVAVGRMFLRGKAGRNSIRR